MVGEATGSLWEIFKIADYLFNCFLCSVETIADLVVLSPLLLVVCILGIGGIAISFFKRLV